MLNIYLPNLAEITGIKQETPDIKTFKLKFSARGGSASGGKDQMAETFFNYIPGQFVEFSVFGEGEAPFCISNSPTRRSSPVRSKSPEVIAAPLVRTSNGASIECSVKKMGKVTQALHDLDIGDTVGVRGPYGNGFPIKDLRNKNLLFVAGGIGLAPLRSLINYCLDNRDEFKTVTIVNGARTSKDLVYKDEYQTWQKAKDTHLHLTVDCQEENWTCMVGVVPKILEQLKPTCKDSVAIVCGPPIMIKFTMPVLLKIGFCPEAIITTLEMKMKCGLGKCGRCNIGHLYICKDGPVFTYAQLEALRYEF